MDEALSSDGGSAWSRDLSAYGELLFAIVLQNLEEVGGKLSAPLHVVLHSRRWAAV